MNTEVSPVDTSPSPDKKEPMDNPEPTDSPSSTPALKTNEQPQTDTSRNNNSAPNASDEDEDYDTLVRQEVDKNFGTIIGTQVLKEIQRLHGEPLSSETIKNGLRYYVPPKNIEDISAILDKHRVVVIHSQSGFGRYTTATNLLNERTGGRIRQVQREPREPFSIEGIRERNTGWILDLRAEDEKQHISFGLRLSNSYKVLREQNSHLIVVTNSTLWERTGNQASHLGIPISPPPALDVLRAYLGIPQAPMHATDPASTSSGIGGQLPPSQTISAQESEGVHANSHFLEENEFNAQDATQRLSGVERWPSELRIQNAINNKPPAEVAKWAEAILQVEKSDNAYPNPIGPEEAEKAFQEKIESVIHAANDWRTKLRQWHEENTESEYRNYLLAAAALDGAPVETIRESAEDLATKFGENAQRQPGQQGKGIIELTYAIEAELTPDDTVRFTLPGYAKAIVDYFWVDRPTLVSKFTEWTAEQAAELPREIGQQLADRVSDWALRYSVRKNSVTLLRSIAEQWAHKKSLRPHARDLLIAAAVHPDLGQRVRRTFLTWAKEDLTVTAENTKHLKIVLAEACGKLGEIFPTTMLRRLAEMANSPDDAVTKEVGHALGKIWNQSELRPRVQNVLQDWDESGKSAQRESAHHAFIHLATQPGPSKIPALLVDYRGDHTGITWITQRWRSVLENEITSTTQETFNTWMNAAVTSVNERSQILDIFHHAVYRPNEGENYDASRFLTLSHLLFSWAPTDPNEPSKGKDMIRDQLVGKARESDPASRTP